VIRRYIFLPLMAKGYSRENAGTAVKFVDSKQRNAKKHKGELHGGRYNSNSEGDTNNGSSGETCNFCGLKGHKEAGCFKKFPEKAPAWFKEKTTKAESATSSMEVSLASLNPEKLGIDISKLQEEGNDTLAILCQENVRICDMGASTYATWSNKDAKNIRDSTALGMRARQ
jgi:hypothetical protein